jgi:DNA mismatch repair protein MutL
VHPSKTEVRFRQNALVHDFVRESVRSALIKARPMPEFTREITAQPTASPGLSPGAQQLQTAAANQIFALQPETLPLMSERLQFGGEPIAVDANMTVSGFGPVGASLIAQSTVQSVNGHADTCGNVLQDEPQQVVDQLALASLKPLGQVRDSFILAVNADGLWIIDQHVAHERVLFEKILRERGQNDASQDGQRLLMPLIVELTPGQQAVFAEISEELRRNGFEVELFGTRTIAVKTAPGGVRPADVEKMLVELLDQFEQEKQVLNLEKIRAKIAASIACHAAIKINMPLEQNKMEWLLKELAKTEAPMTCPHGRPVVLRYSVKEIQKAFKRI